ncbi:HNH endonuclease [Chloroflexota bacterium]
MNTDMPNSPSITEVKCPECGRRRGVKIVTNSGLCPRCAAKIIHEMESESENVFYSEGKRYHDTRYRNINAEIIALNDQLNVTTSVQKRLQKKAEFEINKYTTTTRILYYIGIPAICSLWVAGFLIGFNLFGGYTGGFWIFAFIWFFSVTWLNHIVNEHIIEKPWKEKVNARIFELAEERRQKIEEQEIFYDSPEWMVMRSKVIEEEGPVCNECKKNIPVKRDISVDHIKPRSKYPELALDRTNLRVLCRSCNSRKGARDWLDI